MAKATPNATVKAARGAKPSSAVLVPRERILVAAARLFRERGYRATTVRDISAEVGILSGSLFHHFSSKEQMLVEMLREAAIAICVSAEDLVSRIQEPTEQLRMLVRLELGSVAGGQTRDYYAALVSEWREVPIAVQPELRGLRGRYLAVVQRVLEACHAEGKLRIEIDAAALVLHGVNTSAVTWFRSNGRYSVDQFGDILTGLVLKESVAPHLLGSRSSVEPASEPAPLL